MYILAQRENVAVLARWAAQGADGETRTALIVLEIIESARAGVRTKLRAIFFSVVGAWPFPATALEFKSRLRKTNRLVACRVKHIPPFLMENDEKGILLKQMVERARFLKPVSKYHLNLFDHIRQFDGMQRENRRRVSLIITLVQV
jgi:hypothetical protein